VVCEEAQGSITCERFNPECYLRELHRSGIEVNAEKAFLYDAAFAPSFTLRLPAAANFGRRRAIG